MVQFEPSTYLTLDELTVHKDPVPSGILAVTGGMCRPARGVPLIFWEGEAWPWRQRAAPGSANCGVNVGPLRAGALGPS